MADTLSFADRIRERYPEGLTGIFAIGGTRTTFILEKNRFADDPGHIEDFRGHVDYLVGRYRDFIKTFYDLGGQNMIITGNSFRGFSERGKQYAAYLTQEILVVTSDQMQEFYHRQEIDPYITGIDIFFNMPEGSPIYELGRKLTEFNKSWDYKPGHRKLVWEIASIPLFSFWNIYDRMPLEDRAAMTAKLAAMTDFEEMHRFLYGFFSKIVYGTEIPMPHFYLGTNKSGDLKWRSPMPISLTGGEYMRLFYTPYPSLFLTPETFEAMLEDLAFGKRFASLNTDYAGKYTSELAQAEYNRVMELSHNPQAVVGLSRRVRVGQSGD